MKKTPPLLSTGHGKVLQIISERVKDLPVIDIGCGNGNAGVLFINYTGADTELVIENVAKKVNPQYNYLIFDVNNSDLAFIKYYDVVLMNAFIDVMNNPLTVFEQVLKQSVKYILLHRQELIHGKTTIEVNKSYGGETYHSKINFDEFGDLLIKHNYKFISAMSCGFKNWKNGGNSYLLQKI